GDGSGIPPARPGGRVLARKPPPGKAERVSRSRRRRARDTARQLMPVRGSPPYVRLAADAPTTYIAAPMTAAGALTSFPHRHLLGIEGFSPDEISHLLDIAESHVEPNRGGDKKRAVLRGRTVINLFFENSTRTRTSFELAGKRLGAD